MLAIHSKTATQNIIKPNLYFQSIQTPELQNRELSSLFKVGYETGEMAGLVQYVDSKLPVLNKSTAIPVIKINQNGHIQINHPDFGNVFSTLTELSGMGEGAAIIGDGIRGLDPAPQPDWKKTGLKRDWPPSKHQQVTVKTSANPGLILFETPENPDYRVKTRGMASVNPETGSITWAFQQENKNPAIDWAAWTVAPFKVPTGKKALCVFPVSKDFNNKYQQELKANNQWELDEKSNIVTVKPEQTGGFFDPFDSETSWCAVAIEGSDKVMVMRSIYQQPFQDKFKSCMLGSNASYIEHEFMAPKVQNGQKSTLACRIDFLPLKELGIDRFRKEKMGEQIKTVTEYLLQK